MFKQDFVRVIGELRVEVETVIVCFVRVIGRLRVEVGTVRVCWC